MKPHVNLAIVTIILASILGSVGGVFLKFAFKSFSPIATFMLDYLLASMILIPIVLLTKQYKIARKDLKILFWALLFIAGNSLAVTIGIKYTTVIVAQILYFFTPIVVLLLSMVQFQQKFHPFEIVGVALGLIGGTIIISQSFFSTSEVTQLSFGTFLGNLLVLLAVIFWGCYLVASKVFVTKYPPVTITIYACLTNFLISVPFVFLEFQNGVFPPKHIFPESIISIFLLGTISCVGVIFLYAWATKYTTSFIVSSATYIAPISAALVAIPLLGEKVTPLLFIATLIIGVSFYLTSIYPLRKKK
jgi:drug/metabolite transporter (DMT)-like permease